MSFPNQCDIENLNVNTAFRHFSVAAGPPAVTRSLINAQFCITGYTDKLSVGDPVLTISAAASRPRAGLGIPGISWPPGYPGYPGYPGQLRVSTPGIHPGGYPGYPRYITPHGYIKPRPLAIIRARSVWRAVCHYVVVQRERVRSRNAGWGAFRLL